MIRFAIKCALGLGLLALVLPLGQGGESKATNLDLFGLAVGVQEAVSDIGGFCARSPAACAAARDVAAFAGERIEDGFRIGYAYLGEHLSGGAPTTGATPSDSPIPVKPGAPAFTEAAAETGGPQPYQPPKRAQSEAGRAALGSEDADAPTLPFKVPTPHPRG